MVKTIEFQRNAFRLSRVEATGRLPLRTPRAMSLLAGAIYGKALCGAILTTTRLELQRDSLTTARDLEMQGCLSNPCA